MCEPTTIALTAMAAAGAYSAWSQTQAGREQAKQLQYQAAMTDIQSELVRKTADRNAITVQDQALEQQVQLNRDTAQMVGTQKAVLAANGMAASQTARDILLDTHNKAKLDEATIRYNADLKTAEIMNNAEMDTWNLQNQKNQLNVAAQNARKAANREAVGTLLSTAAQTYKTATFKNRPTYIV